jgi:hypothetical protein
MAPRTSLWLLMLAACWMCPAQAQGFPGEFQLTPRIGVGLAGVQYELPGPQRFNATTVLGACRSAM